MGECLAFGEEDSIVLLGEYGLVQAVPNAVVENILSTQTFVPNSPLM